MVQEIGDPSSLAVNHPLHCLHSFLYLSLLPRNLSRLYHAVPFPLVNFLVAPLRGNNMIFPTIPTGDSDERSAVGFYQNR